ncbi:hypothetical protein [Mycoplasma sp. Mirounga ES2805-ORL]|uniref:hypothetical protein n=1 Tax=Mycoplasma sp. Mirounga ES2805-ORL TaxID=754514 RepID=UPI00197BF662|nr:hypothetical protein [Mycoplasma sp. Mirounga ES2805-ORL]QSF13742.1 hypothetical protein JXZ90_00365 [Mycoplasma sp. Mirounga ES2805-ORL]
MAEEKKKDEVVQEKAPAVVGLLKVSDETLNFDQFVSKKVCAKKNAAKDKNDNSNLTPRERAILERKKKK